MDAAVASAVGIVLEASLFDGAVGRDERRHDVARAEPEISDHAEQWVHGGARAPDVRLAVAAPTTHKVETRAEALVEAILLRELFPPRVEHFQLVAGQGSIGHAGSSRVASRAGIFGQELRLDDPCQAEERHDQDDG